jgi:hypothetical protein
MTHRVTDRRFRASVFFGSGDGSRIADRRCTLFFFDGHLGERTSSMGVW